MDHDEQRERARRRSDEEGGQPEEDPSRFEKIDPEEREEQSPALGEEGTEEDRGQWEKTRDMRKEADSIPEEAGVRDRRARDGRLEEPPGD